MADGVIVLSDSDEDDDDVVCLDDVHEPHGLMAHNEDACALVVPWTPLQLPRAQRLAVERLALVQPPGANRCIETIR